MRDFFDVFTPLGHRRARHICANFNSHKQHDIHHEDIAQLLEHYDAVDPESNDRYTFLNWNNRRDYVCKVHVYSVKGARNRPGRCVILTGYRTNKQQYLAASATLKKRRSKPDIPPMVPGQSSQNNPPAPTPKALVQPPVPVSATLKGSPIPPTPPAQHQGVGVDAYVAPYLFATGYYASRAEHRELTRTSASRIQLRAEAENARPKTRPRSKKQ